MNGTGDPRAARTASAWQGLIELVGLSLRTPLVALELLDSESPGRATTHALGLALESEREASPRREAEAHTEAAQVAEAVAASPFAGEKGIAFFARTPLLGADGQVRGQLCVADRAPRELTTESSALALLAKQAVAQWDLETQKESLRHASELLQDRELRLRALFDSMREGVIVQDRNGTVVSSNAAAQRILKATGQHLERQSAHGPPLAPLVRRNGTPFPDSERPAARVLRTGEPVINSVMGLRQASGKTVWISTNAAALRNGPDEQVLGVVVTIRDITEEVELQEALARSLDNFRVLVASLPVGIAVSHGKTMRYVNRALVDILGYDDASELVGRETSQVIHPRSEQALRERYAAMTSTSHPPTGVLECLQKDGTPILIEVTSMPTAFEGKPAILAIVRDVTESSRAREAQERSEARFRALVNFSPVGIFEISAEGKCVYANDQLAAMTGLTLPKILEEGWLRAVHPQDLPALQAKRAAAKTNGGLSHDFRLVASHGVVHVQARSVALTNGSEVTGYLGAVSDVTQLREAQAALEESLGQKDMLLKEIHHRVKNNLQVVASLLRLGRSYVKDPAALSVFNDSVARVHSIALIHERLYQTKNLDRIEMAGYLQGLVSEITRAHSTTHHVATQVLVDRLFFDLDRCVPIGLIVNELVANALKHAFTEPATTAPGIIVALHEGTHEYALVVRDNGRGLNPEKRREGSLGLRIVESLAKQLGGKLRLEQEHGTAWHVTFSKHEERG